MPEKGLKGSDSDGIKQTKCRHADADADADARSRSMADYEGVIVVVVHWRRVAEDSYVATQSGDDD